MSWSAKPTRCYMQHDRGKAINGRFPAEWDVESATTSPSDKYCQLEADRMVGRRTPLQKYPLSDLEIQEPIDDTNDIVLSTFTRVY
jgi:hypothetical protein